MPKLSLISTSSTTRDASSLMSDAGVIHIPSHIAVPPPPYDLTTIVAITKVRLGPETFVYHAEIWRGRHLPLTMTYRNIITMEVYALHLEPLAHRMVITEEDGSTHTEYEVALPPYSMSTAARKVTRGVDPDFDGDSHQLTHYESTMAHIWATAFLLSPDHLLFQIHHIQNGRRLRRGLIVKAPGAWLGDAIIGETLAESAGWTLLEFRLLTSNAIIYVRSLSEFVAKDRTCWGQGTRWMRIKMRKAWGTYNESMYARCVTVYRPAEPY